MNLSKIKLNEIFREAKETKNLIAPEEGGKGIVKGKELTRRGLIEAFQNKSEQYRDRDLTEMGFGYKKKREIKRVEKEAEERATLGK
jgi:hypothetical protein